MSTDRRTHEDVIHVSMEYYSGIKSDPTGSCAVMQMNLESVTQSEVNEKNKYHSLTHIYGKQINGTDDLFAGEAETDVENTLVHTAGEGENETN